jgi:16S rRNA (guanine1207-N2)-methyltransferase
VSSEQYFSRAPSSRTRRSTVRLALPDVGPFELVTDRGVFSAGEVDAGTRILLRRAGAPPVDGDLLDLGCGYGPIAIALAVRSPNATVWAVDVNARALALTIENAAAAGLDNVRAVAPDALPPAIRFRAIYSNPPIRIGKGPLHELLSTWLAKLEPTGGAWLVVQRNLGSDSLGKWLADEGFGVTRIASERGYRVLEVRP